MSFYEIISTDQETTLKTIVQITNGITCIVDKIQQFLNYWERKYKYLWDQDKDAYIRRYEKAGKPLSSFIADITKHTDLQEEVIAEDAMSNMKFLRINCGPLKQSLINHCVGWVQRFTSLLHRLALTELQNIHQYFKKHTQALTEKPQNLEDLSNAVNLHRQLREEERETEARFDPLRAKYSTLERFEMVIPDEELALLEALDSEWELFLTHLDKAQEMLDASKDTFRDRVNSMVAQFKVDVREDYEAFTKRAPYNDEVTTEEAMQFISASEAQIEQKRHQASLPCWPTPC